MKRIRHVEIRGGSIPGRATSEFESKVRKTCSVSEEQKGWHDGSKAREEMRSYRYGHGTSRLSRDSAAVVRHFGDGKLKVVLTRAEIRSDLRSVIL